MGLFDLVKLFGGLAFFLYGMHVMSNGLEKMAGGKLEKTLRVMTSTTIRSLALGAGITIAIQSSSAMTVMLVGLVNSGIMQLSQTVGVIMGSNIGTTLTAWILSLSGIDSDVILLQLLKPKNFAPIFALVGIIMIMASKNMRKKDIGAILVGFAVLMSGMEAMSSAVSPLAESESFASILTAFKNPIIGVLVGTVFTGIIQSSAASVGILQALALTGSITFGMAIPIIMGQNIGTCVTSLISSIGVSKNAKRVAVVHISFNVIGTAVCLTLFMIAQSVFGLDILESPIGVVGIAACHSIFNVFTTLILIPFSKQLVKIAEMVIKSADDTPPAHVPLLDERLLNTPGFAVSECGNLAKDMAKIAVENVYASLSLFDKYDERISEKVLQNEEILDMYEDKLGTYLVRLSSKDPSEANSREISKLLHTIGNFERLGDHAVNLLKAAGEKNGKKINFSAEATAELKVITAALSEILHITLDAFINDSIEEAMNVEPLEQVIDKLVSEIKNNHINRLQRGDCTIELGFVLSDILTNYERISDHCSNIAVAMIEVAQNSFDTHEYLNTVKNMGDENFKRKFAAFSSKYAL